MNDKLASKQANESDRENPGKETEVIHQPRKPGLLDAALEMLLADKQLRTI